jgi:hypothetical protein
MEYVILTTFIWQIILHMEIRRTRKALEDIKNELDNTKNVTRQILQG